MRRFFERQLERLLILIIGAGVAYVIFLRVLPRLEYRLPMALAVFLTYIMGVYIYIPIGWRFFRILRKPNHIPTFTTTPDGFHCDPVNLVLIGTKKELHASMRAAGWHKADERTVSSTVRLIYASIRNVPYVNAPFSNLFLFGRRQDVGYQMPIGDSPKKRHHVRFWAVRTDVPTKFQEHVKFWRRHHYFEQHRDDVFLWVGAATKDVGVGVIRYNLQMTHAIDPDTNKEREFVIKTLRTAGAIGRTKWVESSKPFEMKNRVIGNKMIADGRLLVADLDPVRS